MDRNRTWVPWQGSVNHSSTGPVNFKAVIQPLVHPAHIGADHPKYRSVGSRTEVVYFDLYDDDGQELPHPCMIDDDDAVRELIRRDYLRRKDEDDEALAIVAERLREVVA